MSHVSKSMHNMNIIKTVKKLKLLKKYDTYEPETLTNEIKNIW